MVGLHIVFPTRAIVDMVPSVGHLKVAPSEMRTETWCSTHCMPHR